jgi:hypothetical protein
MCRIMLEEFYSKLVQVEDKNLHQKMNWFLKEENVCEVALISPKLGSISSTRRVSYETNYSQLSERCPPFWGKSLSHILQILSF